MKGESYGMRVAMSVRKKAFELLIEIAIHGKYSNLLLKKELVGFDDRDKALISNIVYGTLQNYRYINYQWKDYTEKPVKREIKLLLDMSVYQMFFLDRIPDFAIIDDAVEIAKGKYEGKYAGFVNAILRQVQRKGKRTIEGDDFEELAIRTSFPTWIVRMWAKQYGMETTIQLCEDSLHIPNQTVRINTIKSSKEELMQSNQYTEGKLSPVALYFKKGSIAATEDFKYGRTSVQDEASQMVALTLNPTEDDVVLDMCSAPGSKTGHMAALMKNRGKIIATDIHPHRLELVKATMRRLGCINVDYQVMDATKASEHFEANRFDKVLVDAPCSGYGTLKRKNEIKMFMEPEDMDGIIKTQKGILAQAYIVLKPGGEMVYSTCTLNKKENELQIKSFIEAHPDMEILSEETIFPFTYDSDGFFICKMRKMEE